MAIKGYWRLNGNSNDASGNGYNGADINITYSQAKGVLNGGAAFGGASSSAVVGALNITANITISAMIFMNNKSATQIPIGKWNDNISQCYLFLIAGGDFIFGVSQSSGVVRTATIPSAKTSTGKWYHVVGVFLPSTYCRIYLNAVLINENTTSMTSSIQSSLTNTALGHGYVSNSKSYYFNGNIDEAIIDNSSWTPAKVKNEYSRVKGFF